MEREELVKLFSVKEVKHVVWGCDRFKSLGAGSGESWIYQGFFGQTKR